MKRGEWPLLFEKGSWIPFNGTLGAYNDSIPITESEAMRFCEDGTLPDRVIEAIRDDTGNYPDPWDD